MKRDKKFSKGNTVWLKKISLILAVVFVLSVCIPMAANAEDKVYSADRAEFVVNIQDNGNATVTEKWDIHYISGDFTRFYKDIYKKTTKLEKFDGVTVIGATINGVDCLAVDEIDRIDYHFYYEKNSESGIDTIHWFYGASNETVHYEITYVLNSVVKETDNNTALFCYRFIGANFPVTVAETTTRIIAPGNSPIEVRFSESDDYTVTGNTVILNDTNVAGMLKYNVAMDSTQFHGLKFIPFKKLLRDEKFKSIDWAEVAMSLLGLAFWGFVAYGIIYSVYEKTHYKKLYKKNPRILYDIANEFETYQVPTIAVPVIESTIIGVDWLKYFNAAIFDMGRRGHAYISQTDLEINSSFGEKEYYDQEVQNILAQYVVRKEKDGHSLYSFADFCEVIMNKDIRQQFSNSVYQLMENYKKVVADDERVRQYKNSVDEKQIKKNINTFKKVIKVNKIVIKTDECFNLLDRYGSMDYYTVLVYLYSDTLDYRSTTSDNDTGYNTYDDYSYLAHTVMHSSSSSGDSGGSGCSSCSSCSGCGGGGAD